MHWWHATLPFSWAIRGTPRTEWLNRDWLFSHIALELVLPTGSTLSFFIDSELLRAIRCPDIWRHRKCFCFGILERDAWVVWILCLSVWNQSLGPHSTMLSNLTRLVGRRQKAIRLRAKIQRQLWYLHTSCESNIGSRRCILCPLRGIFFSLNPCNSMNNNSQRINDERSVKLFKKNLFPDDLDPAHRNARFYEPDRFEATLHAIYMQIYMIYNIHADCPIRSSGFSWWKRQVLPIKNWIEVSETTSSLSTTALPSPEETKQCVCWLEHQSAA